MQVGRSQTPANDPKAGEFNHLVMVTREGVLPT